MDDYRLERTATGRARRKPQRRLLSAGEWLSAIRSHPNAAVPLSIRRRGVQLGVLELGGEGTLDLPPSASFYSVALTFDGAPPGAHAASSRSAERRAVRSTEMLIHGPASGSSACRRASSCGRSGTKPHRQARRETAAGSLIH